LHSSSPTRHDYFSRYVIAQPIKDADAKTTAKIFIDDVICKHGRPDTLLSDLGSNFMSKLIQEVLLMMGTESLRTTAYHPRTNGLVERFNGTLMDMLATLCNVVEDDWGEMVQPAVFAYNTTTQATLEENPFFIIHGRDAVLPGEPFTSYKGVHYGSTTDYINQIQDRISQTYVFIKQSLETARAEYLARNTNIKVIPSYSPGDEVWLLLPSFTLKAGKANKFVHPWTGPYVVLERRSDVVYRIHRKGTDPARTSNLVNIARLKPVHAREGQEEIIFNQPLSSDLDQAVSEEGTTVLSLPELPERRRKHPRGEEAPSNASDLEEKTEEREDEGGNTHMAESAETDTHAAEPAASVCKHNSTHSMRTKSSTK
jgi:hypothetical protein